MFRSAIVSRANVMFFVLTLLLLVMPLVAFAQAQIVPCDGTNVNGGTACTFCHIAQLAQNLINTGIYIAVFLSAILFAYAGWQYITAGGDPGKAGEARKIFWNVGIGLVLILAAWLLVDLIMKILVDEGKLFGPWNQVCGPGTYTSSALPGGQPIRTDLGSQ